MLVSWSYLPLISRLSPVAVPAFERVGPVAADEDVAASPVDGQGIVAALADEDVVAAGPAIQDVRACIADEDIVRRSAGHICDTGDATGQAAVDSGRRACCRGSRGRWWCRPSSRAFGSAAAVDRAGQERAVAEDERVIQRRSRRMTRFP